MRKIMNHESGQNLYNEQGQKTNLLGNKNHATYLDDEQSQLGAIGGYSGRGYYGPSDTETFVASGSGSGGASGHKSYQVSSQRHHSSKTTTRNVNSLLQPQQQQQLSSATTSNINYLQNLAPKLSLEPPSYVVFSNTTGAVIPCMPAMLINGADNDYLPHHHHRDKILSSLASALGPKSGHHSHSSMLQQQQQHHHSGASYQHAPVPTSIHWKLMDGSNVKQVPELRYVRHDGALVFVPFTSDNYRQDIHSNAYRCCLENSAGSLCSRIVHVRAGK